MQVAVVGSGSWGTALAILVARKGHKVTLHGRDEDGMEEISRSRENNRYLPGFPFPDNLEVGRIEPVSAEFCILAVPSDAVMRVVIGIGSPDTVLVASKGLEPKSGKVVSEAIAGALPSSSICALSGPNLAVEVAKGVPTVTVVASEDVECAEACRDLVRSDRLRTYISDDIVGVQMAGALKNVYALGAGMSDGLGFGDNSKGAFLARSLNEMARFGMANGAKMETFFGVAGVGDLIATATSALSRNYRVGRAVGEGASLNDALDKVGQVAEGVSTCHTVVRMAQEQDMHMPIAFAIQSVLTGKAAPLAAVANLMESMPLYEGFEFPEALAGR